MKKTLSRRNMVKVMVAAPAVTAFGVFTGALNATIPKNGFSHNFKLSLNLYSFNSLLRSGDVDLFDMLDLSFKNFEELPGR